MVAFTTAQNHLVDQLKAQGIIAAAHARALHDLPAVLIAPANFEYNRLSKRAYSAEFEAYIIARDSGYKDQPLDDLYPIAQVLAEEYGAISFEAVSVTLTNLGNGDGLPALKTTITLDVKEIDDE